MIICIQVENRLSDVARWHFFRDSILGSHMLFLCKHMRLSRFLELDGFLNYATKWKGVTEAAGLNARFCERISSFADLALHPSIGNGLIERNLNCLLMSIAICTKFNMV